MRIFAKLTQGCTILANPSYRSSVQQFYAGCRLLSLMTINYCPTRTEPSGTGLEKLVFFSPLSSPLFFEFESLFDLCNHGTSYLCPIIWDATPRLFKTIDTGLKIVLAAMIAVYFFSEVYLVVESFIQIFHHEPRPAFTQPIWSTYFPHLG
jgi:hypothetical protein